MVVVTAVRVWKVCFRFLIKLYCRVSVCKKNVMRQSGELKRNFDICGICVSSMRVELVKVLRPEIAVYKAVVIRSLDKRKL